MTVADLIAELTRLPGYLPVAGVFVGKHETKRREVVETAFEGRYVALRCDGQDPVVLR